MKICVLGAGNVGSTLGKGLAQAGHEIVYAVRNPDDPKHKGLIEDDASVHATREAVAQAEVVILATPWANTQAAVDSAGDFGGKPLLDATNPIGPGFALTHGHNDSGAEQVQRWATNAHVVKVFNTTGRENMANPTYGDRRVAMFLCGDHEGAVETARALASDLGFEPVPVGPLERARLLEPMAMVWIRMAITEGYGRDFAFSLLHR